MLIQLPDTIKDLYFVGDVHGSWDIVTYHIRQYKVKDTVFIFCGDVGIGFEDTQIGKVVHSAGRRAAFRVVLDENGSGTGVNRGSTQQVQHRYSQGNEQGDGEPVPFGNEHAPQILYPYKVIGGFADRRFLFNHNNK